MKIVYTIGVLAYKIGVQLAAPFSEKAKLWLEGRKNWQSRLPETSNQESYWFHCASLGEFEQARPLMEYFKSQGIEIYLSFFSPSGFEQKKNWQLATWIGYLPIDSEKAAESWYDALKPNKVFFVKYEFWYHFLKTARTRNIPLYLISARLRAEQPFFKWYGSVYREMLGFYTEIFSQDKESVELLKGIGINHARFAGDTRFDRVIQLKTQEANLEIIEQFKLDYLTIVLGSSWPEEEELVKAIIDKFPSFKWIIVPHDIGDSHLNSIEKLFDSKTIRYSKFKTNTDSNIMIVDQIGILGQIYSYADLAFIGGGFNNALHNILEAAVWGIPVLYGDDIQKYPEGTALAKTGGGFMLSDKDSFEKALLELSDKENRLKAGLASKQWIENNKGATERILLTLKA